MAAPATLGDVINMEYTRGGPGDTDNRGATLVERHNERMQEERENTALEKLSALMPTLGSKLRAFALAKSEWDVDGALALLRSFQVAELDRLNAISKKRKRIAEEADEAAEGGPAAKAGGGGGASSGGGGGSSSSESGSGSESSGSDSDGSRRKRKRGGDKEKRKKGGKDKKRKRKGKDKEKSKSRKDKGKRKEREEERRGKEKRAKRRRSSEEPDAKAKAHSSDFGKFGVIREADSDRKRSEFLAWALDVKKVDVEALARWEEKEMFKEFVEDFNTGTLPHKKYYDLAAYEMAQRREEAEKAAARAATKQGTRKAAELNDDQELHRRRVEERQREQEKRVREAMQALRKGGMAEEMRRQEMLRAEMALAYKTGDTARAQKLFERLAPDDPAKKKH